MKFTTIKTTSLFILFIATTIISCSSDETFIPLAPGHVATNYNLLPLTVNNSWTYDVNTDTGTPPVTNSTDIITADGTVIIDSKEYTDMSMSAGSTGIMSTMLDQNNLRNEGGITYMNGNFNFPLSQLGGSDIIIALDDTKIIDQNVADGTTLSTINGTTNQTIATFDLAITYTLTTIQREELTSHTVNSETYNNVIASDIIISATVTTNVGGLNFTLLPQQDVYVIKNYYADGIGLIDSNANFTYNLADLSALPVTIPIPETATVITTQQITAHTIN